MRLTFKTMNKTPLLHRPSIEKKEYEIFLRVFAEGGYGSNRLGQAFYNRFNLHRVTDQERFGMLYELDGEVAKAHIQKIFTIE